ncbi:MAG: serine/threonine protein kinase [Planctomycetaceae bacterium]|jgi:serine/threonine protein kinase|nr:serine/threonine protein kinase [Planctomycetaceae bacterium]
MSDNVQNLGDKSNIESELLSLPSGEFVNQIDEKILSNAESAESTTAPLRNILSANLTAKIFATGTIPAGTLLGHFMVQNYIGGGGMGRVYLATDTLLDRKVAVKVLPHQRINDQSIVARFMNEAKSAARLNHEHIAQVYFAGEQDGVPFIVFEYVEGTNIRKMINESGVFPLPQTLNYMLQISHALVHAAENGVVHRDVKPSNILITREGKAKLIDMGLARLLNPSDGAGDLTASGVTLGTFDYISPEQARDPRNADIRSDIYSLGCTFFFMLAGRPPFPEGTVLQKLLQHQGDLPPDIRELQPNIPAEIAILLQKMMAKDPKQRFQSPDVLIAALIIIARKIGMHPVGHGHIAWTMPAIKKTSFVLKHAIWLSSFAILICVFILMNILGSKNKQLELPVFPDPPKNITNSGTNSTQTITSSNNDSNKIVTKNLIDQFTAEDITIVDRLIQLHYPILETVFFGNVNANKSDDFSLRLFEKNQLGIRLAPYPVSSVILPETYLSASIKTKDNMPEQTIKRTDSPDTSINKQFVRRTLLRVDPTFDERFEPIYSGELNETNSGRIRTYTNLKSAVEAADTNSIIELRWNDFLITEPFSIREQNIHFVAAEGYHPVILFEPAKTAGSSPGVRSMMTVNSCEIEFLDVSIEMRISQDVLASRWTLFDIIGNNKFDFSHVTITIANASPNFSPYHQDVAFFRSSQLPSRLDTIQFIPEWAGISGRIFNDSNNNDNNNDDVWKINNSMMERFITSKTLSNEPRANVNPYELSNQLNINLSNSMIRGEAMVLQCEAASGINFVAEQSIIATAKSFIQIEENKRGSTIKPVRIKFERVTFASRQPFAQLITNDITNNIESTQIDCNIQLSLFILNNMPLFEFVGKGTFDKINSVFKWKGNRNDFQNIALAWQTKPANTTNEVNYNYIEYLLSDWIKRFDREAGINRLFLPDFKKPMYQLQQRDFIQKTSDKDKTRPASGWTKNY